ncbi:nucleoside-diphosphate kinase [Aestuariimicrobium ganziense]|uniref:nucleoside-diphosphate kinase n=1 Tax=Aestuariimicrobium ganziense TaxID=2773677 RepID=UPI0019425842|nr:nucleoside-diphosphate kinase [Aestuariimicrobium ganziense]
MTDDRTLVLLKPDAVSRGLTGLILARYEAKGLRIVALRQRMVTPDLAAKHYEEHHGRPYYDTLVEFITSGPVVSLVLEGERAIEVVRLMNGSTDAGVAAPGTIRGDYSLYYQRNIVHASDSPENAAREIALWFQPDEVAPRAST